ncbi:hypothetical protein RJ639_027139 [Escallonia herrerae]|uniref:Protein SPIRAL1-like 1 n=1 Tax=Escallonia herrerae TaxID=1293975 RepID=A0AA89BQ36_9ASTE|nr:hypothetical protein RJ639_027139 [Escallonia herrerae]
MGRGVSSGGGQSSLGYLFGSGEAPKPSVNNTQVVPNEGQSVTNVPSPKPSAPVQPVDVSKQLPAGIHSTATNNYLRADGQNTGNFITVSLLPIFQFDVDYGITGSYSLLISGISVSVQERPSTKVHAAPGGGSSLNYLFGGGGK